MAIRWPTRYHSPQNLKTLFGRRTTISHTFEIVRMAQCGITTELDDASRFLIFASVQDFVFFEEDKRAFMQFSEADQVHWLRGVDKAATKVWRYEVHATAREYFQNSVFGPTIRGKVEEYQSNLGLGGSTKCVMDM